jgi:hypothetical protein
VSVDQEQIRKLDQQLDRAIEEFDVRTHHPGPSMRAHDSHQVTSSVRVELVVEDVRALSVRLSKRLEELNHETAKINQEILQIAMNRT